MVLGLQIEKWDVHACESIVLVGIGGSRPSGPLSIEHQIPGGYQLDALLRGWAFQRAWHRARLDLVARVLPPANDGLALDAAAGSGIVTWKFGSTSVVSTDLRVAACRFVRSHSSGARAAAADLCALPFRDSTFTSLYLLEAIEHLREDDGKRALRELRRVARPGARCLITTPNYRSHWVALERLLDAVKLTPPMAEAQHQFRYDERRLADVASQAGWRIVRQGSFNLFAPFAGMVVRSIGQWALDRELSMRVRSGALLYAICEPRVGR
jgi:SAM-dependent methyltransferase